MSSLRRSSCLYGAACGLLVRETGFSSVAKAIPVLDQRQDRGADHVLRVVARHDAQHWDVAERPKIHGGVNDGDLGFV